MILPSKHIRFSESFLGLGGIILSFLKVPKTIDELWVQYSKINDTVRFPAYHDFDNVVLALDYLFLIGAIEINFEGKLFICN